MNEKLYDAQASLIYSIIVAGKSANFADKATRAFLVAVADLADKRFKKVLPFRMFQYLTMAQIELCARKARTGNYAKLARACAELKIAKKLNLFTCSPEELEKIHGIGQKTSRFFIMWIRPSEVYAALDVHVLRWLQKLGYKAPGSTPQNPKVYKIFEDAFIAEAKARNMTPRELDMKIWEAGAGRTQLTPLPVKIIVVGSNTAFERWLTGRVVNVSDYRLITKWESACGFRWKPDCGYRKDVITLIDASFTACQILVQHGFKITQAI